MINEILRRQPRKKYNIQEYERAKILTAALEKRIRRGYVHVDKLWELKKILCNVNKNLVSNAVSAHEYLDKIIEECE